MLELPVLARFKSDVVDMLLARMGTISGSFEGPVERIQSAKSLVDSVTTCGSRAIKPLFLCTLVFLATGRLMDRRFVSLLVREYSDASPAET